MRREFHGVTNPFAIFGLKPHPLLLAENGTAVTIDQLKAVYVKLQSTCHPDMFATAPEAVKKKAEDYSGNIVAAYKALGDDLSRVKAWLSHEGIELEKQTQAVDMEAFERQMALTETVEALNEDWSLSQEPWRRLNQLKTQALDTLAGLASPIDQSDVFGPYGDLALATRLLARWRQIQKNHSEA